MGRAAVELLVLAVICLAALGCSQKSSTGNAAVAGRFVITPWEVRAESQAMLEQPRHGIDSLRAAGFDTVAFVRPDQVAEVEKAGLRALVGRPTDVNVRWRTLSDRAITAHVRELIHASGRSRAVLGYLVADEPGVADFPALAKAVAAVKRLAPGKLAYVNLYPGYATSSQLGAKSYRGYLERYVSEVKPQFISFDNYAIALATQPTARVRETSYYRNLVQVRRVALAHGLPFWVALSSKRIRPQAAAPTPASLRLQAFAALAAGARGLTWFTYYPTRGGGTPIDPAGKRTATWSYLRKVNQRVKRLVPVLRRLRSTGVYFSRSAVAGSLPLLPGKLVRSVRSPTSMMVGEFAGAAGTRYALVVNLNPRRAAKAVVKVGAEGKRHSLRLAAGQGALLKL